MIFNRLSTLVLSFRELLFLSSTSGGSNGFVVQKMPRAGFMTRSRIFRYFWSRRNFHFDSWQPVKRRIAFEGEGWKRVVCVSLRAAILGRTFSNIRLSREEFVAGCIHWNINRLQQSSGKRETRRNVSLKWVENWFTLSLSLSLSL